MSLIILGHRGMGPTKRSSLDKSDALPENSIPSFLKCLNLGGAGIEFDVRITKDGRVVVFHDESINDRLVTGINSPLPVEDCTLDEIQSHNIGAGCSIPTLEEVLDTITAFNVIHKIQTGKNIKLNIELKGRDTAISTYNVLQSYIRHNKILINDVLFNSSNWNELTYLKELEPSTQVCPNVKMEMLILSPNKINTAIKDNIGSHDAYLDKHLAGFLARWNCYGIDIRVSDICPLIIDFCHTKGLNLVASECEGMSHDDLSLCLSKLTDASSKIPTVIFKTNNISRTKKLLFQLAVHNLRLCTPLHRMSGIQPLSSNSPS